MNLRSACLLLALLTAGGASADDPFDLRSAHDVNEGTLNFLAAPPATPFHHHQNRILITPESLASGWVRLDQCHDSLDKVGRAQITFREGFIRDLKVVSSEHIESAWVEGPSVQLRNVATGARLCLSAETRALRNGGSGFYMLHNGPYMRKFLDGYYPMRVSIDVAYPEALLALVDITPAAQPGLKVIEAPGAISVDAVFEGELRTLIQFQQK
ncbi:MAG: hypothetical protein MUE59_06910 [Thiobacillaceae bacterium]|jgi:hypothetical protein|nr:hypothetical protein [Thiobacillaceae bacterium]